MVEMKNKLSSLQEENRRLRQQMHKKKIDSGEVEAEQDRSLYNLLQEYMMENQSLRNSNKELRQKALSESKISMKNSISTEIPQLKESSGSSPEPSQSISTRMSSKLSNRTVTSEVSTQTPVQPRHRSEREKKKTEQPAQKPKKAGYSDLYEKRKPSSDIDFKSVVPPLKLNHESDFGKNDLPHPLLPNHPQVNRHYQQGFHPEQNSMPIPSFNAIPQGAHHSSYNANSYHPSPMNYQQSYPPPNYYPFAPVPPRPGQQGPAYMSDPMRSYRMSQRDADQHLHQGRSTYRPERQHQQQRKNHHY